MNNANYFKDLIESKQVYRKMILSIFFINNDKDLLKECRFLKKDMNCLTLEFKNILMEENDEYLEYTKNEEKSILERILNI